MSDEHRLTLLRLSLADDPDSSPEPIPGGVLFTIEGVRLVATEAEWHRVRADVVNDPT